MVDSIRRLASNLLNKDWDTPVINLLSIDEFLMLIMHVLFWAAQQTGCCSSYGFSSTVDNAFIYCPTNRSCNAKCYRGFIFPTGHTNRLFSCQKGVWTPVLSTCKCKMSSKIMDAFYMKGEMIFIMTMYLFSKLKSTKPLTQTCYYIIFKFFTLYAIIFHLNERCD